MTIWINNRQRTTVLSQEKVRKKAAKILSALELSDRELSLTLINDRAMAHLNRETFGRRGPTNVIAFPLDDTPSPGGPPPPRAGGWLPLAPPRRRPRKLACPWRDL